MSIRAIETEYKGYRFRSRLEARWAVFFDNLSLEWRYEPEGFELPDGTRYLPDFWLPSVRSWAEVKAGDMTPEEDRKCLGLSEGTGFDCLALEGPPANRPVRAFKPHQEMDAPWWYPVCLTNYKGYPAYEARFFSFPECDCAWNGGPYCRYCTFDDTQKAAEAARAARFEFGESGAPRKRRKGNPLIAKMNAFEDMLRRERTREG